MFTSGELQTFTFAQIRQKIGRGLTTRAEANHRNIFLAKGIDISDFE